MRSSSRATWARPNCSTTTATGCAGWCWRRAPPPATSTIVARAMGIATVGRVTGNAVSQVGERRRRSSSTATTGDDPPRARRPTSRSAHAEKVQLPRQAGSTLYRACCATSRRSRRDGVGVGLNDECRPARSTCRSLRRRAPTGIGLFRTELQFMVASTLPRDERADRSSMRAVLDASGGPAPSPSARSISAATRCCPICACHARGEPGARLAGDPPRRSTGRRSCACRFARC